MSKLHSLAELCHTVYELTSNIIFLIFSERQLRYVRYMLSPFRMSVCLSSVCDVGAPYSAG